MKIINWLKPKLSLIKKIVEVRWFRLAIQILVLALCLLYLITNLRNIRAVQVELKLNIYLVILSSCITIIAVFLGAFGYWLVLKAFMVPIRSLEAMYIHIQSNLAKYIPGYAWQLVGKAYLTGKKGVSSGLVGFAMAVELMLLFFTGVFLALLSIPKGIVINWGVEKSLVVYLPFMRMIAFAILLVFPLIVSWLLKKVKQLSQTKGPNHMVLLAASFCMFTGWVVFGTSFWLLGRAIIPITINLLPAFIFTLTTSFLIGLAIVIIPGSIGVRESVMVWLLGPIIGTSQAVILAALARIIVIISELLSAFFFQMIVRGWNNPKVLDAKSNINDQD